MTRRIDKSARLDDAIDAMDEVHAKHLLQMIAMVLWPDGEPEGQDWSADTFNDVERQFANAGVHPAQLEKP